MSHTSDQLCYCADALIVNASEVLLHLHQKYQMWLVPGGHIDPGENPYKTALREAKEETGLELEPIGEISYFNSEYFDLPLPLNINQHPVGEGRSHLSFAYVFTSKDRNINPGPDEHPTEFKWFSIVELENSDLNIPENVRIQCTKAINLFTK